MRRKVAQAVSLSRTNGVWHLALYKSEIEPYGRNSLCGRADLPDDEQQDEVPRGDRLCAFCADTPNRHQERPRV